MRYVRKILAFMLVFVMMLSVCGIVGDGTGVLAKENNEKRITFKLKPINDGTGVKVIIGKDSGPRCYSINITKRNNSYKMYSGTLKPHLDNVYTEKNAKTTYVIKGLPKGTYTFQIGGYRYYEPDPDDIGDPGMIMIPDSKKRSIKILAAKSGKTVDKSYDFSDVKKGDIITFGSYEQDDDMRNGKEDIEWIVLSKDSEKMLVLSRYILDCMPYDMDGVFDKMVNWGNCTLNEWLNLKFYDAAFSKKEKSMIKTTVIQDEYDGGDDLANIFTSKNKVFLLSEDDITNTSYGFSLDYKNSDKKYHCTPTEYAIVQGVYSADSFNEWPDYERFEGEPSWWLRSSTGAAVRPGYNGVYIDQCENRYNLGIRPAIYISLTDNLYSDDDLCQAALKYYEYIYGSKPPYALIDSEKDRQVTIQLLDYVQGHTNTWEWFYIDRKTGKGTSMFSGNIDLTRYLEDWRYAL